MNQNYIFKKRFEEIFTKERILFTAKKLKIELKDSNFFDFLPHKKLFIPKNDQEFREINIPDTKTKIIQKILQEELSYHLKFSDRNYAYQRGKSPIKAINRVKHIIKSYQFVLKTDIDNFFDSINHNILLKQLQKIILDKKILYLITIFLKNGTLFKGKWEDKLEGVYQGDVISPLLANIYLDPFDRYFEKKSQFVRFADDLIFFANTFHEAKKILKEIKEFLKTLKLTIDPNKTYIRHKSKPFEYLGVIFDEQNQKYSIDNDRLMKKISKISQETKKLNLQETIKKLNEHITGFNTYYKLVTNNEKQFELLQKKEDEILIKKIIESKKNKTITKKSQFIKILQEVKTYIDTIENYPFYIVNLAYEELKLQTPIKSAQKVIENKKRLFFKNYLKKTELVITKTGTYIYYSKGKIKIRTKDQPLQQIPFKKVKRIIITNRQTSISTYLIYKCSEEKIDIDFISQNTPYALITYFKNVSNELFQKQLIFINSPHAFTYAKNLLYSKAKNQINLLKYFNQRRDDPNITIQIKNIDQLIKKLKKAKDTKELMGFEGQISQNYWNGFRYITKLHHFVRTHKDSKDPINQALNYGYAIIYNRVQSALIREGFNIYYSFLHTMTPNKPALVFDMVEIFRQPIVDREIISIITKKQHLKQKNGLLDSKSKKNIIQNIQERLSSFTKTKYGKTTYYNLIDFEANSLKLSIMSNKPKHKFFIAKY